MSYDNIMNENQKDIKRALKRIDNLERKIRGEKELLNNLGYKID